MRLVAIAGLNVQKVGRNLFDPSKFYEHYRELNEVVSNR